METTMQTWWALRKNLISRPYVPDGDIEPSQVQVVFYADAQATVEALQAQVKTARHDAVRAFVRGEDKMCLVCGATEPCELKDDPSSPCTFDPTPMELKQQVEALQRERDVLLRQVDNQRRTIQRYQASQQEHTQLQALVRALPSFSVICSQRKWYLRISGYFCSISEDEAMNWNRLMQARATLDATPPAKEQHGTAQTNL